MVGWGGVEYEGEQQPWYYNSTTNFTIISFVINLIGLVVFVKFIAFLINGNKLCFYSNMKHCWQHVFPVSYICTRYTWPASGTCSTQHEELQI